MDLFEITSNYNLTTCPRETPFTVNFSKTCFDCPKGMFNLGEQKCIFCEEGKFVNYTTGQCQDCYGELSYEFGIAFCRVCEDEADTFLNQDTKKCQKCSSTEKISDDKKSCTRIECPADKPLITAKKTC